MGNEAANQLYNAQTGLLTGLSSFLGGQIGQPGPVYAGDLAPPPSALQQTSFDLAQRFATQPNAADPALARLLAGETGFVPGQGETEAFFQSNVAKPLARGFDTALNQIDQRLAMRGLGDSGVRARAFTDANRSYADSLERGRSEYAYKDRAAYLQSRESALDRMSGAIAQSLGLDLSKIAVAGGAGDVQREIQGQQAQDAFRRFLEAQPIYNPAMQLVGGPIQQPASIYQGNQDNGQTWVDTLTAIVNPNVGGFFKD